MTKENPEERTPSNSDERKWADFRANLNRKYEYSLETETDWNRAAIIFSKRLDEFFFKPIKRLLPFKRGEGFAIVTLQCALIETFAAFKKGQVYDRTKEPNDIYYKESQNIFTSFLNEEDLFKDNFGGNEKPSTACFYSDVRCGLMHETRTKDRWIIIADALEYRKKNGLSKAEYTDETLIKKASGKHIIFRNQLQTALDTYFKNYKEDLIKSGDEFEKKRKFFARKLDHLFLKKMKMNKPKRILIGGKFSKIFLSKTVSRAKLDWFEDFI